MAGGKNPLLIQKAILANNGTIVNEDGTVLVPSSGGFSGGTVPDPTTFEDTVTIEEALTTEKTVTHQDVVTFQQQPIFDAGMQVNGVIFTVGGVVPFVTGTEQQVVTSSGAIDLTAECHLIDTDSGALALTLAANSIPYQKMKFRMINDGGGGTNDATLTFNGTATIVFADLGDYAELQHNGAEWIPVELVNPGDGSIPVYTPAV